jgi:hypothetical protein
VGLDLDWLPPVGEGATDVPDVFTWLGPPPPLAKTMLPLKVNAAATANSVAAFDIAFIWFRSSLSGH